jgi:CubicO group peptidase (beta-lactamase class C family)
MLNKENLDIVLQEIMVRWDVPGLAVGIVEGDNIVYTKGFGVQSLQTQTPVTPVSVFCVQSISKCFVATATMQLVAQGRLELDAPIVRYLPYFQMDDHRYRQITIRQMLSHTSGMPDMENDEYIGLVTHPEFDDGAAERFVRGLRSRRLIASPGECFSYSNIAYNVLGDLIAKISAQTFETAMQEQLLIPSGMPNSTFQWTDIPTHTLAWPHLRSPQMRVNPVYPYHRADAPASFQHTTVVDLCHWCITCLNRGSYLGQSILSASSYEQMWKPVAKRGNPPSLFEEMGLGWSLGHFKGVKTICHGGAGFGWTAFLLILPEMNYAAVVLCNEESSAHLRAIYAVADVLIGQKPNANRVSWLVPISRALAEGGIDAAYARYSEIQDREDEFYFGESELLDLAIQLFSAKAIDLAIDVLGINIHVYPDYIESYIEQAKLYQLKGEMARAKASLLQALSIEPGNSAAAKQLSLLP